MENGNHDNNPRTKENTKKFDKSQTNLATEHHIKSNRIPTTRPPQLWTTTRPEQHGFRAHHSTATVIVNTIDNIMNNTNKKIKTAAVLLDIEKAFDKVWHDGLIFKLIQTRAPPQLTNTIKSFLFNRNFHVKVGNNTSSSKAIKAGVSQESNLSPQLLMIYVDDMPQHLKTKTILFADNTLIYAKGPTNNRATNILQDHLNMFTLWSKD